MVRPGVAQSMWRNQENRLLRIVKLNDKTSVSQAKAQDADFDCRWPDSRLRRNDQALTNAVMQLCSSLQNEMICANRSFLIRHCFSWWEYMKNGLACQLDFYHILPKKLGCGIG